MLTRPASLITALLLLPLRLSNATDFMTVAVGSDIALCGLTCNTEGYYLIECLPKVEPVLKYHCDTRNYTVFEKAEGRLDVSEATGCATIRNVQRSDMGRYDWRFCTKDGKEKVIQSARYNVIDKVSISNLTPRVSNSGLSTSLHVHFTGEQVTVTWSRDGGDLPEGHQLSDFNDILTVRSEDYGTYRVTVTNPVSEDQAERTLTGPESSSGIMRFFWIPSVIVLLPFLVWIFTRKKQETSGNSLHPKDEDTRNGSAGYTEIDCMERAEDAKAGCMERAEGAKAGCMERAEDAKAGCIAQC